MGSPTMRGTAALVSQPPARVELIDLLVISSVSLSSVLVLSESTYPVHPVDPV